MKVKRVVAISDPHCGARTGLTPPGWQYSPSASDPIRKKFARVQYEMWDWFAKKMAELQPIDVLIVNGDEIDGKGEKSGGTELLEADRNKQCEIAAEVIREAKAKQIVMTYGTPYHTGTSEDFTDNVAKMVKAEHVGRHDWYDINGLVFDVKHYIPRSNIPHGRHTPVSREKLWNMIWAEAGQQPKADIFLRAHVHYYSFCGDDDKLLITMPALQAFKTKYVSSISTAKVDIGLISFDVKSKKEYTWRTHLLNPINQQAKALIL